MVELPHNLALRTIGYDSESIELLASLLISDLFNAHWGTSDSLVRDDTDVLVSE